MIKGVYYGKNQKAFRRTIQTGNLSGSDLRWKYSGDLPGSSTSQADSRTLDFKVSTGRAPWEAGSQREGTGEGEREAQSKDWGTGGSHRPFKKIPRDATTSQKRRYIRDHWKKFGSVSKACKRVGLCQSSYYYQPKIQPQERLCRDTELRDQIEQIQAEFPMYGVRRVYWELFWVYGRRINRKRIARVMKRYGLRALIYKGFRISTTDSKHNKRIYPNLLAGKVVSAPNQIWVSDITYVRVKTCFVFLAAILDVFSRKVVGWAISKKINARPCLEALKMAIENRNPGPGCIHHSDRGVQYASSDYVALLKESGFEISMSRKANCWDNAFVESFFGSLKTEEVYLCDYEDFTDVLFRLPQFIEDLYNEKRRHSSLGGLSPVEFEDKWKSGELEKLGIPSVIKLWDGLSN